VFTSNDNVDVTSQAVNPCVVVRQSPINS